jgi:hypothetical protein
VRVSSDDDTENQDDAPDEPLDDDSLPVDNDTNNDK